jgi:hypothetical protein
MSHIQLFEQRESYSSVLWDLDESFNVTKMFFEDLQVLNTSLNPVNGNPELNEECKSTGVIKRLSSNKLPRCAG